MEFLLEQIQFCFTAGDLSVDTTASKHAICSTACHQSHLSTEYHKHEKEDDLLLVLRWHHKENVNFIQLFITTYTKERTVIHVDNSPYAQLYLQTIVHWKFVYIWILLHSCMDIYGQKYHRLTTIKSI